METLCGFDPHPPYNKNIIQKLFASYTFTMKTQIPTLHSPSPTPRWLTAWMLVIAFALTGCFPTAPADPTATPSLSAPTIVMIDGTPQVLNGPLNPTPTPNTTNPNPVQITELQYTQNGTLLTVLAKLQNVRSDAILKDVQLEIIGLDSVGNRIAQAFTAIRYIFPRETTGLVQTFELTPGLETGTVEIHVNSGVIDQELRYSQPLTVTQPAWFANSGNPILTGWLINTDPYTYTQVALHTIAYNAAGEIIGGGIGKAEFVPAEDKIGVQIATDLADEPARVEIYPWVTAESATLEEGDWWNTLEVQDWNFVLTADHWVGGGAELVNKSDSLLTQSYYIITVSDAQGRVCLVNKGYIDLIWPKESIHFSPGAFRAPQESAPRHVDMIIVPGEFGQHALAYNPLVASQGVLPADNMENVVQINVINNLNANISSAIVSVILRDATGQIVGGGNTRTGTLPASSGTLVEVLVAVIGDLAGLRVEASASVAADAFIGN